MTGREEELQDEIDRLVGLMHRMLETPQPLVCVCGKPFFPKTTRPDAKFCSARCGARIHQRALRARKAPKCEPPTS